MTSTERQPDTAVPTRWRIDDDTVVWPVREDEAHRDFFEMCGEQVGVVVHYAVDDDAVLTVTQRVVWPRLRFEPGLTGDHLRLSWGDGPPAPGREDITWSDTSLHIALADGHGDDGTTAPARGLALMAVRLGATAHFDGVLQFSRGDGVTVDLPASRTVYPSVDAPATFDRWQITNPTDSDVTVQIDGPRRDDSTDSRTGVHGTYVAEVTSVGDGLRTVPAGGSIEVVVVTEARGRAEQPGHYRAPDEWAARTSRVAEISSQLRLETPDPVVDSLFRFATVRTTESIIRTRGGLMHAPGGGYEFYAAIWANDQAEYANPFFGMSGDAMAVESAINSFRHFARYMNPDFRPIPSSIISEGAGSWQHAGDRGDMAMIAYGAGRFALALGDRAVADELWPLIEWCLEYLQRQRTAAGVIASESDELEGRFPTGSANLSTAVLTYDALRSAVMLGHDIGADRSHLESLDAWAEQLRTAIEDHFGATVEGFETYRYFDRDEMATHPDPAFAAYQHKPDVLRAWIGLPLTVGITERASGTADALFSDRLWTADGLRTASDDPTIWDRSTLYGLRGAIAAGDVQRATEHLLDYSRRRLLGDHVPYPFEAHPEGDKRQLAAESALYCRVFTEGYFGLRPTGLRSMDMTPHLPAGWPRMALRGLNAGGRTLDVVMTRRDTGGLRLEINDASADIALARDLDDGQTVRIDLSH